MEDSFHINLTSDTMCVFHPNNTPSAFANKLQRRIDLADEWEVAIIEFTYPMTICNFYNKRGVAWVKKGNSAVKRFRLKDDYCDDVATLLKTLENGLNSDFTFSTKNDRVICTPKEAGMSLRLSQILALQLGFPKGVEFDGNIEINTPNGIAEKERGVSKGVVHASNLPNLNAGLPTQAYIHSNIVKPQFFGDRMLQLMRCFTIDLSLYVNGGQGSILFPLPQYVGVRLKELDQISIDIKDRTGVNLPFSSGTCTLLLHFRRRSL